MIGKDIKALSITAFCIHLVLISILVLLDLLLLKISCDFIISYLFIYLCLEVWTPTFISLLPWNEPGFSRPSSYDRKY